MGGLCVTEEISRCRGVEGRILSIQNVLKNTRLWQYGYREFFTQCKRRIEAEIWYIQIGFNNELTSVDCHETTKALCSRAILRRMVPPKRRLLYVATQIIFKLSSIEEEEKRSMCLATAIFAWFSPLWIGFPWHDTRYLWPHSQKKTSPGVRCSLYIECGSTQESRRAISEIFPKPWS